MRHVSVDSILQHATEIPSGQPRGGPPGSLRAMPSSGLPAAAAAARRRGLMRRTSGSGGPAGMVGSLAAGGVGGGGGASGGMGVSTGVGLSSGVAGLAGGPLLSRAAAGLPNTPSRTTKISEKLVLLPETGDEDAVGLEDGDEDEEEEELEQELQVEAATPESIEAAQRALRRARIEEGGGLYDGARPPRDEELDVLRKRGGIRGKSYAERLPKGQRTEKVARVTAYCTAQAFKMRATAEFLRTHHQAKAKMYDDCLYTVYHLPLLPGLDGYRVRSRPILKTPGTGKTVLDLEIERSERRDEHMGYDYAQQQQQQQEERRAQEPDQEAGERGPSPGSPDASPSTTDTPDDEPRVFPVSSTAAEVSSPVNRLVPDAKHFAELFVFSYGVAVFWNFTEQQEKAILADLAFAESEEGTAALAVRPLDEGDLETEEFHFEYNSRARRPRVFNDMITLLPRSDHMVKLTISHAIAQSTKLCFFEEQMSETLQNAQHVPKQLALTGELDLSRTEIFQILGLLFKNRVDINLSSNILDVPNFFWDAEPTLHPLYVAIREYLEIDPRIQVLNERCRVFLDLAEILADSVADAKMSYITWICILLIVLSICVTVTEVLVRFGMLEKNRNRVNAPLPNSSVSWQLDASAPVLQIQPAAGAVGAVGAATVVESGEKIPQFQSIDELRAWAAQLDSQERAAVCGSDYIGRTFAGV